MTSPHELSEQDINYIEQALGRLPRGVIAVSCRDPEGNPAALKMHCVVDKTPFPTHFWLCHPLLIEKVNFLESQRLVKPLELIIEQTPALEKAFFEDQRRYQEIRNECLTSEGRQFLEEIGILDKFLHQRGIGGIEDFSKIRCFHMQVAHLISDDNVIGQMLQDEFNLLNFNEDLNQFRQRLKQNNLV
jgi:hypothetical protein